MKISDGSHTANTLLAFSHLSTSPPSRCSDTHELPRPPPPPPSRYSDTLCLLCHTHTTLPPSPSPDIAAVSTTRLGKFRQTSSLFASFFFSPPSSWASRRVFLPSPCLSPPTGKSHSGRWREALPKERKKADWLFQDTGLSENLRRSVPTRQTRELIFWVQVEMFWPYASATFAKGHHSN